MMRTVLLAACMAGVHALSKDRLHSFWGFANEVEVPNESDASYPFEGVGPYGTRIWRPESQGLRWRLTVTLPAALPVAPDDADTSLTTRMPVVFLFNGFMASDSMTYFSPNPTVLE